MTTKDLHGTDQPLTDTIMFPGWTLTSGLNKIPYCNKCYKIKQCQCEDRKTAYMHLQATPSRQEIPPSLVNVVTKAISWHISLKVPRGGKRPNLAKFIRANHDINCPLQDSKPIGPITTVEIIWTPWTPPPIRERLVNIRLSLRRHKLATMRTFTPAPKPVLLALYYKHAPSMPRNLAASLRASVLWPRTLGIPVSLVTPC